MPDKWSLFSRCHAHSIIHSIHLWNSTYQHNSGKVNIVCSFPHTGFMPRSCICLGIRAVRLDSWSYADDGLVHSTPWHIVCSLFLLFRLKTTRGSPGARAGQPFDYLNTQKKNRLRCFTCMLRCGDVHEYRALCVYIARCSGGRETRETRTTWSATFGELPFLVYVEFSWWSHIICAVRVFRVHIYWVGVYFNVYTRLLSLALHRVCRRRCRGCFRRLVCKFMVNQLVLQ